MERTHEREGRTAAGAAFALLAFGTWGLGPLYFRPLHGVPPLEVLAHRVTWSALLLLVVVVALRRTGAVLAVVRQKRLVLALCGTALLIATNWLGYLWGIEHARIMQVSLGYFTNPLLNVALGALVLRERMSAGQRVAVAIAGASVAYLAIASRQVPWLAVILASTFALYGLFRKLMPVDPVTGLLVETWVVFPVAVTGLVLRHAHGHGALFAGSTRHDVLLLLAGAFTTIPLMSFVAAAQRLPLTVLGFFQYLAPTLQLGLALLWGEPFDARVLAAFCGIWTALGVVSVDALRRRRAIPPDDAR